MEGLPAELHHTIFAFLSPSTLRTLTLVSRQFHTATSLALERLFLATPLWLWVTRERYILTLGHFTESLPELVENNYTAVPLFS